jgi:tRNA-splicing ligase RtcB
MPEHLAPNLVSWASILDDVTREQAILTSKMPFVRPHLALMPDAHLGKGSTVGSVLPTVGAIMPAAVGVDIGCGMIAARTQWTRDQLGESGWSLAAIRAAIEMSIPLSAGNANTRLDQHAAAAASRLTAHADAIGFDPSQRNARWQEQLGTLGSGNHFIEVSHDEEDRVWIFLHSGSRGVGNKIAMHHIAIAEAYCARNFIKLPHRDLAYLVEGTPEFIAYIEQMTWAQDYAAENRLVMLRRVEQILGSAMGEPVVAETVVQTHHNYTTRERHMGQDVWLSRKGAIDAHEGRLGLIPGSMGDLSFVVRGKGDIASFCSAPHGAGRIHSRTAARKQFSINDLEASMLGIEFNHENAKEFVDEHPGAYKPIDVVMRDAEPLVEIVHTLRQIINVKGD